MWRAGKVRASEQTLDKAETLAEVIDDARLLGEVRYTTDHKALEKKYFLDLVALVTFHVCKVFSEEKVALLKQRKSRLAAGDWQAYEDIVREIYLKQETSFNQLCDEVLEELKISKQVFLDSQTMYTGDAALREDIMNAVFTGKLFRETLSSKPALAKSLQLFISALQPAQPLYKDEAVRALMSNQRERLTLCETAVQTSFREERDEDHSGSGDEEMPADMVIEMQEIIQEEEEFVAQPVEGDRLELHNERRIRKAEMSLNSRLLMAATLQSQETLMQQRIEGKPVTLKDKIEGKL